jgi:hypothetical protein
LRKAEAFNYLDHNESLLLSIHSVESQLLFFLAKFKNKKFLNEVIMKVFNCQKWGGGEGERGLGFGGFKVWCIQHDNYGAFTLGVKHSNIKFPNTKLVI